MCSRSSSRWCRKARRGCASSSPPSTTRRRSAATVAALAAARDSVPPAGWPGPAPAGQSPCVRGRARDRCRRAYLRHPPARPRQRDRSAALAGTAAARSRRLLSRATGTALLAPMRVALSLGAPPAAEARRASLRPCGGAWCWSAGPPPCRAGAAAAGAGGTCGAAGPAAAALPRRELRAADWRPAAAPAALSRRLAAARGHRRCAELGR